MLLTLEEIRRQLQLDPDEADDLLLLSLAEVAEDYTANYCNRSILADGEPISDDDPDAINITPSLKMAMLLLVGHLYENRESTSPLNLHELPMGFKMLANSKRLSLV